MKNDLHRIIDANINRASEALRVLEEWSRFNKNNLNLTEKLKNIRHEINKIHNDFPNLILSRESIYDVGREIENISPKKNVKDIITSNSKRLEEALRVLCEYGSLINLNIKMLENFRYEIYNIEKELIMLEKIYRLNNSKLYFVTSRYSNDGGLFSDKEFFNIIEQSIEGGVDIIQLREKNESDLRIIELGNEIRKLTLNTNVLFIVNDRVDLALACNADGVHIGQDDFPIENIRKITPDGFLVGLSTHSIEQGKNALNTSADYLGVGPVFSTPTKPTYKEVGLEYVKWASENISKPYFAIGGINEDNADKVINAGAKRIAVVRAIANSKDPKNISKKLKNMLEKGLVNNEIK